MRRLHVLMIIWLCFSSAVFAKQSKEDYHRALWYPSYHGERLSYCNKEETQCGKPIAEDYCKALEYEHAVTFRIDHHVGRTHYLNNEGECTGWKCDGFLFINCKGHFDPTSHHTAEYRLRDFEYPRFDHHRIDWCYKKNKLCGKRAAYSFCRRMGYSNASSFIEDKEVAATKTLGDHVLCYGKACRGFKRVTCKR